MTKSRSVHRWWRLPRRAALILGLGALSSAGAAADASASPTASGDASIRSDGEKIYLSEGGRETELRLGATPQRDLLLRLLEEHGPAGIKLDPDPRLIMSGGGGTGFSLWDLRKSLTDRPAAAPRDPPQVTAPAGPGGDPRAKRSMPRDSHTAPDRKG
jgi:hypothetical protein